MHVQGPDVTWYFSYTPSGWSFLSLITFRKCTSRQRWWCINLPISYHILAEKKFKKAFLHNELSSISQRKLQLVENYWRFYSREKNPAAYIVWRILNFLIRNTRYLSLSLRNRVRLLEMKNIAANRVSNPESRTVWKFWCGGIRSSVPARFPTERTRLAGWRVIGGNWYTPLFVASAP